MVGARPAEAASVLSLSRAVFPIETMARALAVGYKSSNNHTAKSKARQAGKPQAPRAAGDKPMTDPGCR